MILSVSRRTDIPNYYSEWFYNRIKEGFVYVRNPFRMHQVSKIDLSAETVDCIVFWTKNPTPMLKRLKELAAYHYYFQFTLTGYGADIECGIPHKKDVMIPAFQKLSEKIGSKKVVWRYDPILFTKKYTPEYHIRAFEQIAGALKGYTDQCVISFADLYAKNKRSMEAAGVYEADRSVLMRFSGIISDIAKANGMSVGSCSEQINLSQCGIGHSCCIDKTRIEEILGCEINARKDKNQRPECGCMESVDIGAYNTCKNDCRYCYANESRERVINNCRKYNPHAPLLCGELSTEDKITERRIKSLKETQYRLYTGIAQGKS